MKWWVIGKQSGALDPFYGTQHQAEQAGADVAAGPFNTRRQAEQWITNYNATTGGGGQGGGGPSPGHGGPPPSGTRLQAAIAAAARASIGHCYIYGGAPGRNGQACWDCSSAVNFWVGVEAGAAIPGFPPGTYDGSVHGPSTLGWLGWLGIGVFGITRAQVVAGDIMCWQTHMGVAVSNTDMISALNPGPTTEQTPIDGLIPGETLNPLRLHAVDPGVTGIGVIALGGTAAIEGDARGIAQLVKAMVPLQQAARSIGRPRRVP